LTPAVSPGPALIPCTPAAPRQLVSMLRPLSTALALLGLAGPAGAADRDTWRWWSERQVKQARGRTPEEPTGYATVEGEGDDFVIELADEVLANTQAPLPVPWEIKKNDPSYRDTGYVGEHNLLDSAKVKVHVSSLDTGREAQGFPPVILIARFLTEEGNHPVEPPSYDRFAGGGGVELRHLAGMANPTSELTVWGWSRLKWAAAVPFLEMWAGRAPRRMVILHSSGDMIFGGCSENQILYKYNQIVNASGVPAKIVVGGDLTPHPEDLGWHFDRADWAEARRQTTLAGLGVPADWTSSYADCTNRTLGPCSSGKAYQFLDSGFIMGEVEAIKDMVTELSSPVYTGCANRKINEYFLKNPGTVTVDYAGLLSMSLHNMRPGNLPVIVGTDRDKPYLRNQVSDAAVCFVHGSGNSFAALQELARELKA